MKAKTNNTILTKLASRRIEGIAKSTGALALIQGTRPSSLHDLSDLKPEDVLSLLHQGKIREKDAMFWLGVIAVNAEEEARKHQEVAVTDELTKAYNRRAFIDAMSKEIARLHAKHTQVQQLFTHDFSVSLMIVDVDYFKKVNDTYGHIAGDTVLKGIVKILKKEVRDGDTVYRYGGEEFAVVLPEANAQAAHIAAERIRKAIEKARFSVKKGSTKRKVGVTASVGVMTIEGGDVEHAKVTDMLIPKFIARADKALYQAKETGRNKVVVWSKELEEK